MELYTLVFFFVIFPGDIFILSLCFSGNLGLVFMCYKVISSKHFAQVESEYKNYMLECIKANEDFKFKRDVSFLLGKGGYLTMYLYL